MGDIIANLLVLSISIFLLAEYLPGIKLKKPITAMTVAVVYSLVNWLLGALLTLLALPLLILTLGLFIFVINAFLLWLTDKLMDDFEIENIGTTIIAAVIITIIGFIARLIF